MSGADPWWLPYGEMRLFFLNTADNEVGSADRPTVNPPDYGGELDAPHPWANYSLTAIAPAGTTQVKVEFMSDETGSIWYENAVLTESGSPSMLSSATTLPFTVHTFAPPTSQTNYVAGITDTGNGTYLLQFIGTVGVEYYVEATTNLVPPISWSAVAGSTNAVTNTNGMWGQTVTNNGPQWFYRSVAIQP
jgi:hypothetical protein